MKKFLIIAFMLAVSALSFGQTSYDAVGIGGTITGPVGGRATLAVTAAPIVYIAVNGVPDTNLTGGQITFKTGTKVNGTPQLGDTFAAGGSFVISSTDLGTIFSGTFSAGASWQPAALSNGAHFYTLTGTVTDAAGDVGAFVLTTTTDSSITCFFSGSETIAQIDISLNIN